jgi:hypothetical protein
MEVLPLIDVGLAEKRQHLGAADFPERDAVRTACR